MVSQPGDERRRHRRTRRAAVVALFAVAAVALVAVAVAWPSSPDDEAAVRLEAADPEGEGATTTSTAPASGGPPAEAPLPPPPPGRTRVVADRSAGWDLLVVEDASPRCLELVVGPWSQGSLLCGARPAPAGGSIGSLVALDTPIGRVVVAVVEPSVTALAPEVGDRGRVGAHPANPAVAYAVARPGAGEGGRLPELAVVVGADRVARVFLPVKVGPIDRTELTFVTTPPYGTWPGYRFGDYTGLFFGGNQEVGFYDGRNGATCVLYRRFGGPHEEVIADLCPARDDERAVVATRLVPVPIGTPEPGYMILAVTDRPVASWQCERVTGEPCGGGTRVVADPKGTGRHALVQWVEWVTPGPHDRIVLVLADGQGGTVRAEVPVRG